MVGLFNLHQKVSSDKELFNNPSHQNGSSSTIYNNKNYNQYKDVVLEAGDSSDGGGSSNNGKNVTKTFDKQVVPEAFKQDLHALAYASKELHSAKEVVYNALKQEGLYLVCINSFRYSPVSSSSKLYIRHQNKIAMIKAMGKVINNRFAYIKCSFGKEFVLISS